MGDEDERTGSVDDAAGTTNGSPQPEPGPFHEAVRGSHVDVQPRSGSGAYPISGLVVARDAEAMWLVTDQGGIPGGTSKVLWTNVGTVHAMPAGETLVRTYRGKQQADTNAAFQEEAKYLAWAGFRPTTQSWAAGQWGCGAFLVALLLAVVLIGILVFIYMLVVKPEGTLTVTYSRAGTTATREPSTVTPSPTPAALSDRLRHLDEARAAGLITDEEYAAKRQKIIDEL